MNNSTNYQTVKNEITLLRQVMESHSIDIYIIPTDDFHGSEYVGAYFQCRKFLSGFTGSAGTLIVTKNFAGLWTDGRYFLQAEDQLKDTGITLFKSGEPGVLSISEWLNSNIATGHTVGFDGRTVSAQTGQKWEKIALSHNAKVSYLNDLTDLIWHNRPAISTEKAWELDIKYSGKSRGEKLIILREKMQALKVNAHLLCSLEDICWLLNIRGNDIQYCPVVLSYLLVTQEKCYLYVDSSKLSPELINILDNEGVSLRPYFDIFSDIESLTILDPSIESLFIDPDKINFRLRKSIPDNILIVEETNPTTHLKAIKNDIEIENFKKAHIKDGVALVKFMKWLKESIRNCSDKCYLSEISVAEKLEEFRAEEENYISPSFDPIMGYAHHGAIIHYSATPETNLQLKPTGFLLSDTGGHYFEGTTDVTRTFCLGNITPEMKHHYTLVLKGNLNLADAKFKAGCLGINLDYLARMALWNEGLDYRHGTGHGVGYLLSVHEGPQSIKYRSLDYKKEVPFEPGMITSNEPGLYIENEYGIRLENLILCVKDSSTEYGDFFKFETLTLCPFDLDAVNKEDLNDHEISLLNNYHAKVFETLSPYLNDNEKEWLEYVCREI